MWHKRPSASVDPIKNKSILVFFSVVSCLPLPSEIDVGDGFLVPSDDTNLFDSGVAFTIMCNEEAAITGETESENNVFTCGPDGFWTRNGAKCIGKS